MYKLKIILGSTREGRIGDKVAKLVDTLVKEKQDFESEILDLKEWKLPFFNEVGSIPSLKGVYSDPIIGKWIEKISEADAFIFVTPEYNHGVTAVLKNAIDSAYFEWKRKPAVLVGYSAGPIGGARAVEMLRPILSYFNMLDLNEGLLLTFLNKDSFDENGNFKAIDTLRPVFDTVNKEFIWWTKALKTARDESV